MIETTIHWTNSGDGFSDGRYSRAHTWQFDGGEIVPASSSPHIVSTPMSDESAVDPEEAFVASISSCQMLWFLSIAAKSGYEVSEYRDNATGKMARNESGKRFISDVTLHPQTKWTGQREPTAKQIDQMHCQTHDECFIANSVLTKIRIV